MEIKYYVHYLSHFFILFTRQLNFTLYINLPLIEIHMCIAFYFGLNQLTNLTRVSFEARWTVTRS